MTPRSAEFMAAARERLQQARSDLANGFRAGSVSAAYYAMLYAARAALSERDQHAKTHAGTWHLVRQLLVADGAVEEHLVRAAQRAQRLREAGDYDAAEPSTPDAALVLANAEEFIAAIEKALPA